MERTSSPQAMGKSLSDGRNEKGTALSLFSLEEGAKRVLDYDRKIRQKISWLDGGHENLLVLVDLLTGRTH